jgi:hypothetical protein
VITLLDDPGPEVEDNIAIGGVDEGEDKLLKGDGVVLD